MVLSEFDKGRCVAYLDCGKTIRWTAEKLGVANSTVMRWWNRYKHEDHVQRRSGSGRPRITTPREDRQLILSIKMNRFTPVARLWPAWGHGSVRTATRRAVQAGLRAYRPLTRIPLSLKNRRLRKEWAYDHRAWLPAQWNNVLWTDESRFSLDFADGRVRVRRLSHERHANACILEHDRFGGGSIMIWGGIWYRGRTAAVVIEDTMNAEVYRDSVVLPHILPTIQQHNLTLQQDNARPHTANIVRHVLQQHEVNVLPWPARSPDMSPIEHIWDVIGRNIHTSEAPPTNIQQLREAVVAAWNSVPQATIQHFIDSMPRRVQECLSRRGGHTRY